MKTIPELLKMYESFFEALSKKLDKDSDDPIVRPEKFENPTDKEVEELEKAIKIKVPEEIKIFWKNLKHVYEAVSYDDENWVAGRDFMKLEYVIRETLQLRNLAKNIEDAEDKKLHEEGISLTYEEPILLFNSKTGAIHQLLWDGEPIVDPIAPNLATFLEHWLALGCFYQGDFDTYIKHVKDIIPVKIPLKDNLWMQYKKKYDEPKKPSDSEAMAHLDKVEKAYEDGNNAIQVWRSGKEKEAETILKNVIKTAVELGDSRLAIATVCNYAGLNSESGRNDEALKIMQDFFREEAEIANENSQALRFMGQYNYENGKLKEGLEWCNKAVAIDPKDGWTYYTRACAYVRLKNFKEALADIASAVKVDAKLSSDIAEDVDFAPLKNMPEFIKAVGQN